jgi:putative ABC transport system permease protein
MTLWTLILRSLRFHARSHLGVVLGATVGSAVLIGALLVGDSVRESLREIALARVGVTSVALSSGDRMFRDSLLETKPLDDFITDTSMFVVPAFQFLGTANNTDESARANRVQVFGVSDRFGIFAGLNPTPSDIPPDAILLNKPLAEQLKAKTGDVVVVRVPRPLKLSQDTALSPQNDSTIALRLQVAGIASDQSFGRFSLRANQVAPFNAFVSLKLLQDKFGSTNRANLLLGVSALSAELGENALRDEVDFSKIANANLKSKWQLADAELELHELPDQNTLELRTPRVFLDPPVVEAALKAAPDARLIQTYFVNELRIGERSVPYSMVTGAGAPLVPADMKDDEILLNQWIADELQARPGDSLALRYFAVGAGRALEERTNTFRVRAVVPMTLPWADRGLMPEFPGVAKAESTRDWDGSLPIDMGRIRQQDDQYWMDWRGTPKAFVTLPAGERMWNNRFGVVTAVRFPPGDRDELGKKILANLDPASIGLRFEPVREQALKAAEQSQDFGGLFIGFSFFLIVAALLLMALLFQFGIEQRAVEVGTLLALGFTPRQVRRVLLLEGAGIALIGGLLGALGGIFYSRAMLHGLTTIWRDAVGTSALQFHARPMTLIIGIGASVAVALLTIWVALRKQALQPARVLLAGGGEEAPSISDAPLSSSGGEGWVKGLPARRSSSTWIALGSLVLALVLGGWAMLKQAALAETFFGVGALLLIAALAATAVWLTALARNSASRIPHSAFSQGPVTSAATFQLTLSGMGARNIARRRKRSLATVAMLACGSFLIVSIGAFRLDENQNATKRNSGTGGFAFIGESTMPVHHDLNSKGGWEFFGLDEPAMKGVSVVPFRVRDGDDASCLNLNRAQKPRLLGVKPEFLAERGAFVFAGAVKGLKASDGWRLLKGAPNSSSAGSDKNADAQRADLEVGTPVPAIADEASILWALGKKLGDTLDFTDERGRPFKVRLVASLANSILQGNLVIDEAEFIRRFPNESGYRMFFVDTPSDRATEVSASLTRALRDVGLELTPAPRRLAAFNAVQNTYLSTFQVLGGLGLLLGSVGLGVVVLRNVLERRGELALLLAVGFQPRALKWLVMSEHGALLLIGLSSGVAAAAAAVLPALLSPAAQLPYASLALTLLAVLANGALWTWLATVAALRGKLLDALRNN